MKTIIRLLAALLLLPVLGSLPCPAAPGASGVPATTLLSLFRDNERDFQERWFNKYLAVTGNVLDVSREKDNSVLVTLEAGSGRDDIILFDFTAPANAPALLALRKGQTATIRGMSYNPPDIKAPALMLVNSTIVGAAPAAPIAAAAPAAPADALLVAEIEGAFKANAAAAGARFKDKPVTVTGKITFAKLNLQGEPFIALANPANDDQSIICNFPMTAKGTVTSQRAGQTVTIRGICETVPGTSMHQLNHCELVR